MIDKVKLKIYGGYIFFLIVGIVFFMLIPLAIFFLISMAGYMIIPFKIPLIITVFIDGGVLFWFWKRNKNEFFIVLASLVVAITSISIVTLKYASKPKIYTRDNRRIVDIKQLELALELYFKEKGLYPPAVLGCSPVSELDIVLSPNFIPSVPHERFKEGDHVGYKYAVSADGLKLVLLANLDKEHAALESDWDGNVFGCNCNDPNYCIIVGN